MPLPRRPRISLYPAHPSPRSPHWAPPPPLFQGVHEYPTYTDKVKRLVAQFAPESWMRVRWDKTASLKRFFGLHVLVAAIHLEELNAFFLKYLLWVPPESYLNHVRLGFWFFFSLPCLRQFYVFMTDPTVKSIGRQSFLCILIIATECLIIFKLSPGEFTKSQDTLARAITIGMVVSYVAFSLWGVWYIMRNHPTTDVHDRLVDQVAAVDTKAAPAIERTKEEVRRATARQLHAAPAAAPVSPAAAAAAAPAAAKAAKSASKAKAAESEDEAEEEAPKKARSRAASSSRKRSSSSKRSDSRKSSGRKSGSPARSPSRSRRA